MSSKKIIASIVGTFSIAVLFIIFFLIYAVLIDSPLGQNPQTKAILESGQKATQTAFNGWLIIDTIGGIILFGGIIFGVVKLIIKIAEDNSGFGSGGTFY